MQSVDIIYSYFPDLTPIQKDQLNKLFALYSEWNEKINVISRKDIDNLYINHVLHSLGIAKVCSFKPGSSVLDVGTGGGFPGIPLAILFPETNFHLVDSIGKKITVVKNVAEGLGLKNVKAEQIRAEQIKGEYDFIVSRAVTRLKEFYGWINKKVKKDSKHDLFNGILYLKGGDLDEELAELKRPYQLTDLSDFLKKNFLKPRRWFTFHWFDNSRLFASRTFSRTSHKLNYPFIDDPEETIDFKTVPVAQACILHIKFRTWFLPNQ